MEGSLLKWSNMNVRIEKKNLVNLLNHDEIVSLSKQTGLNEKVVELLALRGFSDINVLRRFLNPSIDDFYDPFSMKGMEQATLRIRHAIENRETVVVYGDYDADGICASAILALYLISKGVDVVVHIPNRTKDGYGLNKKTLATIIEEQFPALIISCDCGISCPNECEFVQDLGVDIIVTDHHEISGEIPSCIVVNPKQSDCNYPYKMLCGAGVVLKVIQALSGVDEMKKYFGLASIATIADLVPLTDENRIIVQFGLIQLKNSDNLGIRELLSSLNLKEPTASDIAFKVVPRINAAGRLGDAYRAFELLSSCDLLAIKKILFELNEDNSKRKVLCDEMFFEAVGDLKNEDIVNSRSIILSHPSWEKGITGIVAARLSSEYYRPAMILVGNDGTYKATCRSIDGINIHDILMKCSDLFIEFGGHSQAAGFSILESNIPELKRRVNEFLKTYDEQYFYPKYSYDLDLNVNEITYDFVRSLDALEPTGNGNPKPLFCINSNDIKVVPCKSNSAHVSMSIDGMLQVFAFGYYKQSYQLLGDGNKTIIVELQTDQYGGKSVKGIMKCCVPEKLYINDTIANTFNYGLLRYLPKDNPQFSICSDDELNEMSKKLYGTLLICDNRITFEEYYARHSTPLLREFMFTTSKNNFTRMIVAPQFDDDGLDLSSYENIIFLTPPLNNGIINYLNSKTNAKIYLTSAIKESYNLTCEREVFAKCFSAIKNNVNSNNLGTFYKNINVVDNTLTYSQISFCLAVFSELKLITINYSPFSIVVNNGIKTNLIDSELYAYINERIK